METYKYSTGSAGGDFNVKNSVKIAHTIIMMILTVAGLWLVWMFGVFGIETIRNAEVPQRIFGDYKQTAATYLAIFTYGMLLFSHMFRSLPQSDGIGKEEQQQ